MSASFYTSISKYGSNLLYRGYNQAGHRIEKRVKFEPTLFVNTNEETGWHALMDNANLRPIKFASIKEASDFVNQYKDVENKSIHGMTNWIFQYINERFGGKISFNPAHINVNTLDIEVASDDGFPDPDKAEKEVISIACYSTYDKVWRLWGLDDYDPSKSYMLKDNPDATIIYTKCENEVELLNSFLLKWSSPDYCPDVVTGWYIRFFDIPYIVNRIEKILGSDAVKKLSPWKMISQRNVQFKGGKSSTVFDMVGIQLLDYMDLFQKFGFAYGQNQESYKLDHIAYVILKEKKLSYDEYSGLSDLYKNDHQKFIDYNLRDIHLVVRMDEEAKLLELVYTMAYRAGVNYQDTLGTTAIWDSIINRALWEKKVVIPPNDLKMNANYPGGYVKDPIPGMYDWVVSFDLNSLYPNLIVQYNISPETLRQELGHSNSVEKWLTSSKKVNSKYSVAANGSVYTNEFQGVLPSLVIDLYDERKKEKRLMIEAKQEIEQLEKELHEIEIALGNQ